jgi:hypothetical protein
MVKYKNFQADYATGIQLNRPLLKLFYLISVENLLDQQKNKIKQQQLFR